MTYFEALISIFSSPIVWVSVLAIGGLYFIGRTILGRFQYTADVSPESEAAQQRLQAIHDQEEAGEAEVPARVVAYPKNNARKSFHRKLNELGEPRKTYKSNAVEELITQFGFSLDIDTDKQKLALIDTKYPTMTKNRWELPLSFGNSSTEEWSAKLKRVRMYAERQAVKEGLKPQGTSRKRRVAAA